MKSNTTLPNYSRAIGSMYIICMITSILAGSLLDKMFNHSDVLQHLNEKTSLLVFVTVLDLINAFGVLIIATCFYILLKNHASAISLLYLLLRSIEVAFCIIVSYLPIGVIVHLNQSGLDAESSLNWISQVLLLRSVFWDYVYPILFSFSGLLFYSTLYKTRLLPRYISVWGLIALIGVLFSLLIPDMKIIPGLGIITNELYLGFYLLLKKKAL